MSGEGPSVDTPVFQTPMEVLQRVFDMHQAQNKKDSTNLTLAQRNAQRPRRLFSDVLKSLDRPTHDSDFFKGAGFKRFEELLLKHDFPVTNDLVADTINLFEELDKSFTEDPAWNTFWENVKREESATDEDIEYLKIQTLISYRFKLMSNAMFSIQMNTALTPDEKKQAKNVLSVLQIFNGKYDENKENLAEATKSHYYNQSATNYVQDINLAIKQGIEMLKEGKSTEEVRKHLDLLRGKTFEANKKNDNYAVFYGEEGAKEVFNQYFTVDGMLEKAQQYNSVCEEFGFDLNERMKALTDFREKYKELIGNDNKNEVDNLVILTKRMAYFSEVQLESNDDINKKPSMQERIEAKDKLNKNLEESLLKAVAEGNMEAVHDFAKVGFTTQKKTNEYKRDFFSAVKDGFKDFPKNLSALFNKPPRTVTEIAQISGRKDIVESIETAVMKRENTVLEQQSKVNPSVIDALTSTLSKEPPILQVEQPKQSQSNKRKWPFDGLKRSKEQKGLPPQNPVPELPHKAELDAIDKRLGEIREKEDYKSTDQYNIGREMLQKEEGLLNVVRGHLQKDPINTQELIKTIEDGLKSTDEEKYRGKTIEPMTELMLMELKDSLESPKTSIGMKSSSKS